jgi:peptide/nickel transport system permease protein
VKRFLAARALRTAFVAFFVTSLTFLLVHVAPGDPLAASPEDPPEVAAARARLREVYGLDRPLAEQYPAMLANFARGEFGESLTQARSVRDVVSDVLPRTLLLMAPALLVGVLAGAALGTAQGVRAGGALDRASGAVSLAVLSVPEFLVALLASGVFAIRLGWFPGTGMVSADISSGAGFGTLAWDVVRHAFLPFATLVLIVTAFVSRYQRAAVVDVMREEFVRAVRAKGLTRNRIVLRHVVRRTSGSLFTVMGLLFPLLVGGAALIEFVFGWPGAGSTLLRAVAGRDYPLVIALVLIGSVAVCVGSALADAAANAANPATRIEA